MFQVAIIYLKIVAVYTFVTTEVLEFSLKGNLSLAVKLG